MTRSFSLALPLLALLSLASCTKEDLFPDPLAGTVCELGFEWFETVESCLDSDDHSAAFCGRATWLDANRVQIDLPSFEEIGFETQEPVMRELMAAESIRYVYNPTSRTVTLFLTAGSVTLEWDEALGTLEGDLFDQDYLSIATRGSSTAPGI